VNGELVINLERQWSALSNRQGLALPVAQVAWRAMSCT